MQGVGIIGVVSDGCWINASRYMREVRGLFPLIHAD